MDPVRNILGIRRDRLSKNKANKLIYMVFIKDSKGAQKEYRFGPITENNYNDALIFAVQERIKNKKLNTGKSPDYNVLGPVAIRGK